jgi:DNA-binding NarL/FixJ family response regulator
MLGSEGVIALRSRYPTAAILMLTVYADEERIFESICNGARGYVLKNTPSARLLEFVRAVHAGGAPMSPEVASKVLRVFRELRPAAPRTDFALTSQELRLVGLLAEGHSYQNAADQLSISINTIRNHVRSVYDKLHVHSKSEAVAKALKHGLLR